jgi:putative ABC transport system substrate-binding protein
VVDLGDELAGKRLEFFRELVPGLKRVLVPYAGNDPLSTLEAQTYRAPARQLGIVLVEKPVQDREEAQAAFTKIRRSEVQGILLSHSLTWNVPGFAIEAAARQGIPTMFPSAFYVQEGGLAAYGPDYYATGRQAARLVSKVIKGEKPGEIPVEANPKIEFTINLKVARKLGLQIPSHVLVRADRVFQ